MYVEPEGLQRLNANDETRFLAGAGSLWRLHHQLRRIFTMTKSSLIKLQIDIRTMKIIEYDDLNWIEACSELKQDMETTKDIFSSNSEGLLIVKIFSKCWTQWIWMRINVKNMEIVCFMWVTIVFSASFATRGDGHMAGGEEPGRFDSSLFPAISRRWLRLYVAAERQLN